MLFVKKKNIGDREEEEKKLNDTFSLLYIIIIIIVFVLCSNFQMPSWKINCLKTEDGLINPPSTLTILNDESTNKSDTVSTTLDHRNAGNIRFEIE